MQLSKLYIDAQIADDPEVRAIRTRLAVSTQIVSDAKKIYNLILAAGDPVNNGKQILFLTQNRGAFVRNCPGTRHYLCCSYKILHVGSFCNMDCSYCILQSYFHPPLLQYYVNRKKMYRELELLFAENTVSRIGTGEFTDSLIWDEWTDLSGPLIEKFSAQKHAVLELKTKTAAVGRLANLKHNRKTILSWSLNSNRIIHSEERKTASLSARLKAAAKSEAWGYPIGFHLDPLVIYEGCFEDYRQLVKQIFTYVSPENIVWISLGTFRFMPALKSIIQKRFPKSKIIYGEFIAGLDGKMRYFQPLRIELYRKVVGWIKEIAPHVLIYLCMENAEVWQKSVGFVPSERGSLAQMLDESAVKNCGLVAG